ncbi:hypothetical protein PZ895_00445 [Mesorhizobium sp. YIM 152430]|uniref:hypothetical protein n=1 Tax=Mesorhizobium sp. YIM 152430 TaxID=3031761 RepID=UPI0023DC92E2|nr:hypothetical protein [Mesorhizobium sp. YIM 152430]MDF1598245.1 hypothetical protein [Mesorhizobium sp. YIM 152430]
MAISNAEKVRRYRERQKDKLKAANDVTDEIATRKFFEYLPVDGQWQDVRYYLEWAGFNPDHLPEFTDDTDAGYDPADDMPYRGSIGRAERMIGMLLDASRELAGIVNRYKREELDRHIDKLEVALGNAPEADRKKIAREIVTMTRHRDQLDKRVRFEMPTYEVKGV